MKFIVSSTYLLKQLQVLGGVINNSNTLPILDNFLFELDNNTLTVSASDLETTMSSTLDVESDSNGSVAIPARLLLDTLKTFPEQPLTFVVEENNTVDVQINFLFSIYLKKIIIMVALHCKSPELFVVFDERHEFLFYIILYFFNYII